VAEEQPTEAEESVEEVKAEDEAIADAQTAEAEEEIEEAEAERADEAGSDEDADKS
jgi:large subunit ribosomal protein L17